MRREGNQVSPCASSQDGGRSPCWTCVDLSATKFAPQPYAWIKMEMGHSSRYAITRWEAGKREQRTASKQTSAQARAQHPAPDGTGGGRCNRLPSHKKKKRIHAPKVPNTAANTHCFAPTLDKSATSKTSDLPLSKGGLS